jgi:hypothetical protein
MEEAEEPTGRAKGGNARAKVLSPERRKEISKKANAERWKRDLPETVCGSPENPLRIGDIEIECYVLEDGTRVLTQRDFLLALGRHPKANVRREGDRLPPILQGKSIRPYITDEIREKSHPITFRTPSGVRASGYNAMLLPQVCEIYLRADEEGALPANQKHVAIQAGILVRGLTLVGIVGLVDEATGYQDLRAKNALAKILEAYIAKELQPWVKTFPDEFYREMFRLRGRDFKTDTVQRPPYFGHLTNDVVYKRLAPGVLAQLKRVTPVNDAGRRKGKFHQMLTTNEGYPMLRQHLGSVVTLMKLSSDWPDFKGKLERIHPPWGSTPELPLDFGNESDSGIGL